MTRDQRLFMVAAGEATAWERILTHIQAACSRRSQEQFEQYRAIQGMLGAALADRDDRITVRLNRRHRPPARRLASLGLLGLLMAVVIVEYGSYTVPAIRQYMRTVVQKCGVK